MAHDVSKDLPFVDLWLEMGGEGLLGKHLWIDRHYQGPKGLHDQVGQPNPPLTLHLDEEPWPSGVYLLEASTLQGVHLSENNKAHSVEPAFVRQAMLAAWDAELFVPIPLWFIAFLDNTPPNLYSTQRREYEAMFAARRAVDLG